MTWRDKARQVIAAVIAEVGTDDPGKLKRALFDAYPFGERQYHPYKIWLDEIKVQLGTKRRKVKDVTVDENQGDLFGKGMR